VVFFLTVVGIIIATLIVALTVVEIIITDILSARYFTIVVISLAALVLVLGILGWIYSILRFKWEHYWITDKRIVRQKGIIGYDIRSIPLERISDVIVSRSFLEKILGFGSLHIESLAGQTSAGRYGAEACLLAVPDPESIQQLILELIEEKRKREKLAF